MPPGGRTRGLRLDADARFKVPGSPGVREDVEAHSFVGIERRWDAMDNAEGGTRFAINGAVRLAYDDLGPPAGDPLLMIMGMGASRFWWPQGLLQCLQEHGFRP